MATRTALGGSTGETVTLTVKLRAFVREEAENLWVALCPSIGVASQGNDHDQAIDSLREAVELWFESCVERGTLEQAMRECSFRPVRPGNELPVGGSHVQVSTDDDEPDIRGDGFDIDVTIPAYQMAALLEVSA